MKIRKATERDIGQWSEMRTALWPDTEDGHMSENKGYFSGSSIDIAQAYVAELDSEVIGFLELNIRNFAEGSRKPKGPYVEAWYIKPGFQNKGYGSQFMQQAEKCALSKGYSELASDTETHNKQSISMHEHLGSKETERVVCFFKESERCKTQLKSRFRLDVDTALCYTLL